MWFLGVDGGGTKTVALLVDEAGQVLGVGRGGNANYQVCGLDEAFATIHQAVSGALQGCSPDAACFCLAGADLPYDFAQLGAALKRLNLPCPVQLYTDVIGVFRAGSRFPYGVGVVCGTGFNAGGISQTGVEFRLPAMGDVTGDHAGGGWLGMQAIGAAFRDWDGRGQPTLLREMVLQALDSPNFETLAERWVRGTLTEAHINALAPLVFTACESGDTVARGFILEQGIELATSANAMLRRLNLTETDCDVVLGGSVFYGEGDLLLDTIRAQVGRIAPQATITRLDVPPVVGAVLLASDRVGAVSSGFREALRASLPDDLLVPIGS